MSERPHCAGTRRDGTSCTNQILSDGTFCFAHSLTRAEERAKARQRGGRNKGSAARIARLVPPRLIAVYDALETALSEAHAGAITPQQATAMAAIARAMVAVLSAGEVEQRLRDVESRLNPSLSQERTGT